MTVNPDLDAARALTARAIGAMTKALAVDGHDEMHAARGFLMKAEEVMVAHADGLYSGKVEPEAADQNWVLSCGHVMCLKGEPVSARCVHCRSVRLTRHPASPAEVAAYLAGLAAEHEAKADG